GSGWPSDGRDADRFRRLADCRALRVPRGGVAASLCRRSAPGPRGVAGAAARTGASCGFRLVVVGPDTRARSHDPGTGSIARLIDACDHRWPNIEMRDAVPRLQFVDRKHDRRADNGVEPL